MFVVLFLFAFAFPTNAQQEADVNRAAFWGTPTVDGGKCCQSLAEVRTNIDRIDRELVRLMAERGQYVHEAARFKKDPATVEDPKRAEAVVQKAKGLAAQHGLDPSIAEAAYRAFGLAWFQQGVPCPFLEEESCSIHPDRPLVCREYLVTSPPAACAVLGSGQVRQVAVPLRVWAAFGRSADPEGNLEWMPLCDSLDYATTHPEPADDRTGPQRVEALLREIQK